MPITAREKEGLIAIGQNAPLEEFRRIANSVSERRDALQALLEGAKDNTRAGFWNDRGAVTQKKVEFVTEALLKLSTSEPTELQKVFKEMTELRKRVETLEEELKQTRQPSAQPGARTGH